MTTSFSVIILLPEAVRPEEGAEEEKTANNSSGSNCSKDISKLVAKRLDACESWDSMVCDIKRGEEKI